jgi:hypothetical protein
MGNHIQYFGEEGEAMGDVGEYFGDVGESCAGAGRLVRKVWKVFRIDLQAVKRKRSRKVG